MAHGGSIDAKDVHPGAVHETCGAAHLRDENLALMHHLRIQRLRQVRVLASGQLRQQISRGAGLLGRKRPSLAASLQKRSQIVGPVAAHNGTTGSVFDPYPSAIAAALQVNILHSRLPATSHQLEEAFHCKSFDAICRTFVGPLYGAWGLHVRSHCAGGTASVHMPF